MPKAISPDHKTILYRVDSGVPKGRTRHEWKVVNADGSGAHALELPDDFNASGFTRDGSLYGTYKVNKVTQLAVVPITSGVAALTPSRVILLPRGIHSVQISPDGARFAVLASPGDPDQLDEVQTVVEPDRASLYVVNVDGTNGAGWCPTLMTIADGPIGDGAMAWSRESAIVAVVSQTPKIGFKDRQPDGTTTDEALWEGPRRNWRSRSRGYQARTVRWEEQAWGRSHGAVRSWLAEASSPALQRSVSTNFESGRRRLRSGSS